jgi:outer membrane protein
VDNPGLVAALFTADAAREDIKASRGNLLPTITLEGQLSKGWDTIADQSLTESASARVVLSAPIYQGGIVYARLRQAKHTAGQRRLEADQARLDARESATSTWEIYQSSRASIASIETQIVASEIALEGVQREAEVGARTVLDVLDAEQELLDARVTLVTAQRDELVATLQLQASIGRLTAEDLALGVSLYDAVDHYDDVSGSFFGSSKAADADSR